jgi:hypothetical protein
MSKAIKLETIQTMTKDTLAPQKGRKGKRK